MRNMTLFLLITIFMMVNLIGCASSSTTKRSENTKVEGLNGRSTKPEVINRNPRDEFTVWVVDRNEWAEGDYGNADGAPSWYGVINLFVSRKGDETDRKCFRVTSDRAIYTAMKNLKGRDKDGKPRTQIRERPDLSNGFTLNESMRIGNVEYKGLIIPVYRTNLRLWAVNEDNGSDGEVPGIKQETKKPSSMSVDVEVIK